MNLAVVNIVRCIACERLFDDAKRFSPRLAVCPKCVEELHSRAPPDVLRSIQRPMRRWGLAFCGGCRRWFRLAKCRGSLLTPDGFRYACPACTDRFNAKGAWDGVA